MRGWILGGLVALVTVGALSVPWVPAAEATTVPVDRTWTLEDVETGHCVEVTLDATLTGRELRPVVTVLPWRAWTDTGVTGDTVATMHVDGSCSAEGELAMIEAAVVLGDATCADWDYGRPAVQEMFAEEAGGCGGRATIINLGTGDPGQGVERHGDLYPSLDAGRDGCIDVRASVVVTAQVGDRSTTSGAGLPAPERFCLAEAV